MTSYAEVSNIVSRLDTKGITITDDTNPTATEVEGFIVEYEVIINGALKAQGWTIPATGENDVVMLRGLVADRVAAKVWGIRFTGREYPADVQQWIKDWDSYLNMLRQGQAHLVDETIEDGEGSTMQIFRKVLGR